MDPLEILRREHEVIKKYLSDLDEMTYSVSVNVRDFSFLFKEIVKFWDQHEKKEELLFEALSEGGFEVPIESIKFEHGELKEKRDVIVEAIDSGDEIQIKDVLYGACCELIDRMKAHVLAEDGALEKIHWENLNKELIEKIELLQIVPSRKLL